MAGCSRFAWMYRAAHAEIGLQRRDPDGMPLGVSGSLVRAVVGFAVLAPFLRLMMTALHFAEPPPSRTFCEPLSGRGSHAVLSFVQGGRETGVVEQVCNPQIAWGFSVHDLVERVKREKTVQP